MTESDDPITTSAATSMIVGAGVGIAASKVLSPKVPDIKAPTVVAEERTKTAAPEQQLSETARKNRQRTAAFQPRSFAPPKLGQAGLLGVSG